MLPVLMIILEQLQETAKTMAENAVKAAEETTGTAGLVTSDIAGQLQNLLQTGAQSAVRMAGETGSNAEGILEQLINQTENIGTSSLQNIVDMFSNAGASADDIGGVLSSLINNSSLIQLIVWLGTGAITGVLTLPVSFISVPIALALAAPICAVSVLPLFGFFMTVATVLHVLTYSEICICVYQVGGARKTSQINK